MENLVEQIMKANSKKDRGKLVIEQLIRLEQEHPPNCCLECIFLYPDIKNDGGERTLVPYCNADDKEIEGTVDIDRCVPEWCPIRKQ